MDLVLTTTFCRLSQMILDKVFHGILDQGAGCLVVFDEPEEDVSERTTLAASMSMFTLTLSMQKMYGATLDTMKHVSTVVDSLGAKAKRLS